MANPMEEDNDPFTFIERGSKISASPVLILRNYPPDWLCEDPDPSPRAPDSSPSLPAGIFMDSVPESQGTAEQEVDDLSEFHTPPEHYISSNHSSASDQNPYELCAHAARATESGNGKDGSKQARDFEGYLDGEPEAKKIRFREKELSGATVPLGRSKETVGADTVDIDCGDGDEEIMVEDVTEGPHDDILNGSRVEVGGADSLQETTGLTKQCGHESQRKFVRVDGSIDSSDIIVELGILETENEIVRLKSLVGYRAGKVAVIPGKYEKMAEDGNACGGLKNVCKKIDEFMVAGWDDACKGWRDGKASASGPSGRRRELPDSLKGPVEELGGLMKGEEKNQGGSTVARNVVTESGELRKAEEKSDVGGTGETTSERLIEGKDKNESSQEAEEVGLNDGGSNVEAKVELGNELMVMLEAIKPILGNVDGDEEDSLEIAKRKGISIPRPRWWDPEWSD